MPIKNLAQLSPAIASIVAKAPNLSVDNTHTTFKKPVGKAPEGLRRYSKDMLSTVQTAAARLLPTSLTEEDVMRSICDFNAR